ncbi:MAG TPA: phosphodiester glycosidase family protein [Nocardioides sp.]
MFATHRTVRWAAAGLLSLTMALPAAAPAGPPVGGADGRPGAPTPGAPDGRGGSVLGVPRHSSDDALRDLARSDGTLERTACPGPRRRIDRRWRVTRGIDARIWDLRDADGRTMRASLLTVRHGLSRLRVDYIGPHIIGNTLTTSTHAARRRAIAAVNADFFDISDTGAPLGIGVDRHRGIRHGTVDGWVPELGYQPAFWMKDGRPQIGALTVRAHMKQHPKWRLHTVNAPYVPEHVFGVYTRAWGTTSGVSVTDGQEGREVVVEDGRVVANHWKLSANKKIRGFVIVGRGERAKQLSTLAVGDPVTISQHVGPVRPAMAISGDRPILDDGRLTVVNNTIRHPRTAVGIDRDRGRLLMLVVDGRSTISCGATMVGLGRLLRRLGADDALNFDGGGSSTMYTRWPNGDMGVVNRPSDGSERPVADVLGVVVRR